MTDCEHAEFRWELATNEAGWTCLWCGKKLGFRPDLDREWLDTKVLDILFQLTESKVLYVSNAGEGESLVGAVVRQCEVLDCRDQLTIIRTFVELDAKSHASYWQGRANGTIEELPEVVEFVGGVARYGADANDNLPTVALNAEKGA